MARSSDEKVKLRTPPASIVPIVQWPTPLGRQDVLFYVEKSGDLPTNNLWSYGDPHPDPVRYPNHKLVYVTEQTDDMWSRWYYAADRDAQDEYNWEMNGDEVIRTYVVPRDLYLQGVISGTPWLPLPTSGVDPLIDGFAFVDEIVNQAEKTLSSIYILVRRRFILAETVETKFSDDLQRQITITKQIVPRGSGGASSTSPGVKVETQAGNKYYDVRITYQIEGGTEWLASTTTGVRDAQFPPQLLSPVTVPYAYAFADSEDAAPSFSEDFYFDFRLVDAQPGPYQTVTLTYFTADPEGLLAANPVTQIPRPARESIGMIYAWARASNKGNSTQAYAKQIEIPASVHGEVSIGNRNDSPAGPTPESGLSQVLTKTTLSPTPGFEAFADLEEIVIDIAATPVDFGLHKVSITKLNVPGGLYDI